MPLNNNVPCGALLADKALDTDGLLAEWDAGGTQQSSRQGPERAWGKEACKWRHLMEKFFARIKEYRGIATRYDKTDNSFAGNWNLVAALLASLLASRSILLSTGPGDQKASQSAQTRQSNFSRPSPGQKAGSGSQKYLGKLPCKSLSYNKRLNLMSFSFPAEQTDTPLADNSLYQGNSLDLIKLVESEVVHLILSDIPYGIGAEDWDVLHENTNTAYLGSSPAQRTAGAVFKKRGKPINGWSEADRSIPKQYQEWCSEWAGEWYRILKPGANVFIFAGRRLGHRCVCAMEDVGFSLKDNLAWIRTRAPHRAQRLSVVYNRRGDTASSEEWEGWRVGNLRPIYEPILWFTKPYKIGTTIADNVLKHGVGGYNEKAFLRYVEEPENAITMGMGKKENGLHPTQKGVRLMQALIELTTREGQLVLDPFAGSGSTLVAAKNLGRRYMGFEIVSKYVETCRNRLADDLLSG